VLTLGVLLHAALGWATTGVEASTLLDDAVMVASPLTVTVALVRTRVGLAMAVAVLMAGLVTPDPSLWLALPTALLCGVAARDGRWYSIIAAMVVLLGYMAALLAVHRGAAGTLLGVLEGAAIASVLLGLTVCHFETVRAAMRTELEELHSEQSRIAAEERAGVARELHDVVGHQLSLVSLQSLAGEREEDPDVLGELVRRIQDALEHGESEIAQLIGALHSASDDAPQGSPDLTPTRVATDLARQLEGHHCRARFTIDPRIDGLDPATQRTMARILQESGTNVLRHAPGGADCTFAATLEGDTLTFVARSPLPESPPAPHLSGGLGLRGIRERVELIGGTFFAGSREGWWEVQVCLQTEGRPVEGQRGSAEV
jgi:signal transduction histidine kinase